MKSQNSPIQKQQFYPKEMILSPLEIASLRNYFQDVMELCKQEQQKVSHKKYTQLSES